MALRTPSLLALLLAALLGSACHTATTPTTAPPRSVKLEQVESLEQLNQSYTGVVVPEEFSDLAFKMSGPLVSLNVEEGERVRRGDLIAVIDPLDYRLDYEAKQASYLNARSQLERSKRLLSMQAVSQQSYEMAEANFLNAKAAFEYAQSTLTQTNLRAPFSGFIQKKHVENYQKVQAGQAIVTLINPRELLVEFRLPDRNLSDLIVSNPTISVIFDNYPELSFTALIKEYVEASPDGSGLPVTLRIVDPRFDLNRYQIAVGFACRVKLEIPQDQLAESVVAVPLSAVVATAEKGTPGLYVYDSLSQQVEWRPIRQDGLEGEDRLRVVEGVEGGEWVVVAGATRLTDGERVKPLNL